MHACLLPSRHHLPCPLPPPCKLSRCHALPRSRCRKLRVRVSNSSASTAGGAPLPQVQEKGEEGFSKPRGGGYPMQDVYYQYSYFTPHHKRLCRPKTSTLPRGGGCPMQDVYYQYSYFTVTYGALRAALRPFYQGSWEIGRVSSWRSSLSCRHGIRAARSIPLCARPSTRASRGRT